MGLALLVDLIRAALMANSSVWTQIKKKHPSRPTVPRYSECVVGTFGSLRTLQNQKYHLFWLPKCQVWTRCLKITLIIWSAFTPTSQNDVQEAIDAARKDHEGKEKAEDEEEEQDAHDEDKVEPDPKKLKVNDE